VRELKELKAPELEVQTLIIDWKFKDF